MHSSTCQFIRAFAYVLSALARKIQFGRQFSWCFSSFRRDLTIPAVIVCLFSYTKICVDCNYHSMAGSNTFFIVLVNTVIIQWSTFGTWYAALNAFVHFPLSQCCEWLLSFAKQKKAHSRTRIHTHTHTSVNVLLVDRNRVH